MVLDKPTFRAQFFRELYSTLLIVTSGTAIAAVTFVQNLVVVHSRSLFLYGFILLAISVCVQLLIPLLNVISSGFYWDSEVHSDKDTARQASLWGRASGLLMIVDISITIISIVLLSIFAVRNI